MSARESLEAVVSFMTDRDSERNEWVDDLYEEVRKEVLREAAKKIRTAAEECDGWPEKQWNMRFAADLIDPEKENES